VNCLWIIYFEKWRYNKRSKGFEGVLWFISMAFLYMSCQHLTDYLQSLEIKECPPVSQRKRKGVSFEDWTLLGWKDLILSFLSKKTALFHSLFSCSLPDQMFTIIVVSEMIIMTGLFLISQCKRYRFWDFYLPAKFNEQEDSIKRTKWCINKWTKIQQRMHCSWVVSCHSLDSISFWSFMMRRSSFFLIFPVK